MMKREKFIVMFSLLLACGVLFFSCRVKRESEAFRLKARAIHDRALTVDTHIDTPLHMLREGWKIGERHDPGQREREG